MIWGPARGESAAGNAARKVEGLFLIGRAVGRLFLMKCRRPQKAEFRMVLAPWQQGHARVWRPAVRRQPCKNCCCCFPPVPTMATRETLSGTGGFRGGDCHAAPGFGSEWYHNQPLPWHDTPESGGGHRKNASGKRNTIVDM